MGGFHFIRELLRDNRGATSIEYGLIGSTIVVVIVAAVKDLGDKNQGMWAFVENTILAAL